MDSTPSWRLVPGEPAPRQQSPTTCGSACLVVARMLLEPALARWAMAEPEPVEGPAAPGSGTNGRSIAGLGGSGGAPWPRFQVAAARFAELERHAMTRTNGVAGALGAMRLPWPRALGTPPWGAMAELQRSGSLPGTLYEPVLLRHQGRPALTAAAHRLAARVRPGRPALLYAGSPTLPRHVVLVFAQEDDPEPLVYEPARGDVVPLAAVGLGRPGFALAGWPTPWLLIQPRAQVEADAHAPAAARARPVTAVLGGASLRQAGSSTGARTTSRTSSTSASA